MTENYQYELPFPCAKKRVTVICWKWKPKTQYRSTFTGEHVNTLKNMVMRNTKLVDVDFVCITDDPTGIDKDVRVIPIWPNPVPQYGARSKPNCFRRLKAFSYDFRQLIGTNKFVWIDLDAVITGNIDSILLDENEFRIWRVDSERMPCNGSLVSHVPGTRQYIWDKFNPDRVHHIHGFRKSAGLVGSDQAWIAQNLQPNDKYFTKQDGIFSFRCHIEKLNAHFLPPTAKIVFFHGENKPWTPGIKDIQWIKEHYH